MAQGYRLGVGLHAAQHTWGSSVRLGPRHAASPSFWRASQHSRRPPLTGGGGRTGAPASAKQQPPVQQQQHDAWERACQQVAAFQRQHGRLPGASADGQGPLLSGERPLGVWCTEQQRRKAGSKGPPLTTQDRAALLAIPGWGWWATKRVTKPWEQWRQEVEAFYQRHGTLPRATARKASPLLPGEKEMGNWVDRQRQCYKGNKQPPLSAERIAALEATAGWAWEDHTPWEQRRQEVEAFHQQHGRLPRATAGEESPFLAGEQALGKWVTGQRQSYRGHKRQPLSSERVAALAGTPGWSWGEYLVTPWEDRYQQLQDFLQQHGRLPRSKSGSSDSSLPGEKELASWVFTQRQSYKSQELSAEKIAALDATPGWLWEEWSQQPWELRLQLVQEFVRQHGRIPRQHGSKRMPLQPSEKELGSWCITQRQRRKGSTQQPLLTAEQLSALAAVPGWFWDEDNRWEQQLQQLETFVRQHGRMPRRKASRGKPLLEGERKLGKWCSTQRLRQKVGQEASQGTGGGGGKAGKGDLRHPPQPKMRSGFRPSLAARAGGSAEQPTAPQPPGSPQQQQPVQQAPSDVWQRACQRVAAFQRQHGRLPRASAAGQGPLLPGERPLGVWCTEQQRRKAGSKGPPLTAQERKALLAIPGWVWWATRRAVRPWEQWRQEVEAFYQRHGRLPRAAAGQASPFLPGEQALGYWVGDQRKKFKGQSRDPLSGERLAALEGTPGWSWGEFVRTPWENHYQQVQDFVQQHGQLPRLNLSNSTSHLPFEKELGRWIDMQRRSNKRQKLSAEQVAALEATPGWCWEEWSKQPWELQRQEVEAFYQQHGRLPRGAAGKPSPFLPGEKELGAWVQTQRQYYKGQRQRPLPAERIAALEATLGWAWEDWTPWEQRRQEVEAFCQQHGRLPRSEAGVSNPMLPGERELGSWIGRQRQRYKGHQPPRLSADQRAALDAIPGWRWEDSKGAWELRLQQLQSFVCQHGRMPRQHGSKRVPAQPGEEELGVWCSAQRQHRKGSSHQPPLTAEQLAALAAVPGWYWTKDDR
ncbi:hypothetical protein N2152v2_009726 [Parachlorella kessleri]